jgi:hypothetical protein
VSACGLYPWGEYDDPEELELADLCAALEQWLRRNVGAKIDSAAFTATDDGVQPLLYAVHSNQAGKYLVSTANILQAPGRQLFHFSGRLGSTKIKKGASSSDGGVTGLPGYYFLDPEQQRLTTISVAGPFLVAFKDLINGFLQVAASQRDEHLVPRFKTAALLDQTTKAALARRASSAYKVILRGELLHNTPGRKRFDKAFLNLLNIGNALPEVDDSRYIKIEVNCKPTKAEIEELIEVWHEGEDLDVALMYTGENRAHWIRSRQKDSRELPRRCVDAETGLLKPQRT